MFAAFKGKCDHCGHDHGEEAPAPVAPGGVITDKQVDAIIQAVMNAAEVEDGLVVACARSPVRAALEAALSPDVPKDAEARAISAFNLKAADLCMPFRIRDDDDREALRAALSAALSQGGGGENTVERLRVLHNMVKAKAKEYNLHGMSEPAGTLLGVAKCLREIAGITQRSPAQADGGGKL